MTNRANVSIQAPNISTRYTGACRRMATALKTAKGVTVPWQSTNRPAARSCACQSLGERQDQGRHQLTSDGLSVHNFTTLRADPATLASCDPFRKRETVPGSCARDALPSDVVNRPERRQHPHAVTDHMRSRWPARPGRRVPSHLAAVPESQPDGIRRGRGKKRSRNVPGKSV